MALAVTRSQLLPQFPMRKSACEEAGKEAKKRAGVSTPGAEGESVGNLFPTDNSAQVVKKLGRNISYQEDFV